MSAKKQQMEQAAQAAQDAQAAAEAEANLAAQINSAVETAKQSQTQTKAVSQTLKDLANQSSDAPKKTLEQLKTIQAVQSQMAFEA